MTVTREHQTITSKVRGSWNLHNVASERKLSLHFSTSISSVVGQKGQANDAAADVFLDNFCAYRHNLGLSACSIDLSNIEDVGYLSEHSDLAVAWHSAAWTPISEGLFNKIVRFSLLQQVAQINKASAPQLIAGITVPQPEDFSLLANARFGPLCFGNARASSAGKNSNKEGSRATQAFHILLRSDQADRSAISAIDILNRQFTSSLRLRKAVEPAKPLASYGMGSLAAVKMRNWMRRELDAEPIGLESVNAK